MFGWQACLPVDLMYGAPPTSQQSPSQYTVALQQRLMTAYDLVRQSFKTQHDRQKGSMIGELMGIHARLKIGFGC